MSQVEQIFTKTLIKKRLLADVACFYTDEAHILMWAYRIRLYSNDFAECKSVSLNLSKENKQKKANPTPLLKDMKEDNDKKKGPKEPFSFVFKVIRSDPVKIVAMRLAMIACLESGEVRSREEVLSLPFNEVVDNYLPSFCKQLSVPENVFENVAFSKILPIEDGELLGVDFEGEPTPKLVQIACKRGVMLLRPSDPRCRDILSNQTYIHAIFGSHESKYVANPFDLQIEVRRFLPLPFGKNDWSLGDCFQMVEGCQARGIKKNSKSDPSCIHRRVDWGDTSFTKEMIDYAKRDAIAHLMIGKEIKRFM